MGKGLFTNPKTLIDLPGIRVEGVAYALQFRHPFRLAQGHRTHTDAAYLAIYLDGYVGYGEACLPPYLGAALADVWACWEQWPWQLLPGSTLEEALNRAQPTAAVHHAAAAAIDMALHDLFSRKEGKPLFEYLGLGPAQPIPTTYTLGVSHASELVGKLAEAAPYRTIKMKLGGEGDLERLRAFRGLCSKPFCADANQAYTDRGAALAMAHHLADAGALFLEQPMPVGAEADMAWLRGRSPIPIVADESVRRLADLERVADCFDGFNVKLMKSAGLAEALRMIDKVRQQEKLLVLGAMAESSCGATAASHIASLADYVDLDGPLLLANDPFVGLTYTDGCIMPPSGPGTGARPVA